MQLAGKSDFPGVGVCRACLQWSPGLRLKGQGQEVLKQLSDITEKISDENTKGIHGFKRENFVSNYSHALCCEI